MRDAADLRRRAQRAARAGRAADARALLAQARRRAGGDVDLLALIGTTSAYIDAEQHGAQTGVAACVALLDTPGLARTTRGTIWSQLGLLHMRAGEARQALDCYSEAIPLLDAAPETLGRAHMNRANIHLYLADPRTAVADLTVAMQEFDRAGNQEERGKVEHNIGYAHLLLGDLVRAQEWMDRAVGTLSPVPLVLQSVIAQDRAEVLLAAGRVQDAVESLESAVAAYGAQRLRRFQAEAEFVLARTLLHEDAARARTVARAAGRRFRDHGSESWAERADALAIIAMSDTGTRTVALRERADRLVPTLRARGHRRDAEQLALHAVRLVVRRGDLDDAARRLRRIRIDDDTPIATRLLASEVRAELARARGRPTVALRHVRQGLADLHSWQASFGSLDLQSTMVGHGNALARLGIELALADGRPAVVFEWSERARALASKVTTLRPPPDPELAADLTALRLLDPEDVAEARRLRERIRSKTWFAAEGSVGEPAALPVLHERLARDHAALVAHLVLDGAVTALVADGEGARVVPLGAAAGVRERLDRIAADLDFTAHHPGGSFGATVRASLDEDLSAVADALVSPLLDLIGDRRVVLTPSAGLAGTPWTLLPGLKGRPLTVPTSATRWLELVGRRRRRPARVGLVAGPHLARAVDEVERAAAEWATADVVRGEDAHVARVAEVAARVDLLHLAGHGVHAGDHPLFSAVQLADGPWFGHDIDLLRRTPSVVVLSACELGQVSVLRGEETVGMTAAWLHAGARTVLSSPALVADGVACESLARWHRLVAAGAAPADALAEVVSTSPDVVPFLCFGAGW